MQGLLSARRRYSAIRQRLDPSSETDRGLHLDLTRAIRELDRKLARLPGVPEPGWRAEDGLAAQPET